jgi:hypothetical protein
MGAKVFFGAAMTGALLALTLAASPALACKGAESLLRDDFTEEDPAWNVESDSGAAITNGALTLKSDVGHFQNLMYQGMNFPDADVCVTLMPPNGKPSADTQGGIGVWTGKAWNYIYLTTDGQAGVAGLQNGSWTNPVPLRKADSIKTGNDAVNTLRVVWHGPPPSNSKTAPDPFVTIYINDKQFIKFKATPNGDRTVSLYAETGGGTYQFKNLDITQ